MAPWQKVLPIGVVLIQKLTQWTVMWERLAQRGQPARTKQQRARAREAEAETTEQPA